MVFLFFLDDEPFYVRKNKCIENKDTYEEHEIDFDIDTDVIYLICEKEKKLWFKTLEEAQHYVFHQEDERIEIHELGTHDDRYDKDVLTIDNVRREPFQYRNSLMLEYRTHNRSPKKEAFSNAVDVWKIFGRATHENILRYIDRYPEDAWMFQRQIQQFNHLIKYKYDSLDEYIDTLYLR